LGILLSLLYASVSRLGVALLMDVPF